AGFNNLVGGSGVNTFNFTATDAPVHVVDFSEAPGVDSPDGTSNGEAEADAERVTIGDPPITGDVMARVRPPNPGAPVFVTSLEGQAFVVDADGNSRDAAIGDFGTLVMDASGTYSYELIASADEVVNLPVGGSLSDIFAYTGRFGTQSFTANLVITIQNTA